METAGISVMTGIHEALYWMAPLGMVFQAAAFKMFGASLYVQRALSLGAALISLGCWFSVVRRFFGANIAALACLLLSCDFIFLTLATRGRSDMMSLCFAVAALSSYLALRERSLPLALLAGNTGCAISGLIHPNGGIAGIAAFVIILLYLDRPRLRWSHLGLIVLPYAIGAAGWGIWISRHPHYFVDQFLGNVRNRAPHGLASALKLELWRYLSSFGFRLDSWRGRIRILIPLTYAIGLAACTRFRRSVPHLGLFLLVAVAQALALFLFEGTKQPPYLVHSMPVLTTLVAIWMTLLVRSGSLQLPRWVKAGAFVYHAAVPAIVVAGLFLLTAKRNYQRWYVPAVAFVNAHVTAGMRVIVPSDFFFDLSCRSCMIDDRHLGAYSRIEPDFVVVDYDYSTDLAILSKFDRPAYDYIQTMLHSDYKVVFENPAFHIFGKRRTLFVTR
jgi:4-amino-4-deoxy-L-arabinose transferase-like glycosyltransferase